MSKYEPQVQKCDAIQDLLFDYMTRELGDSRSGLVREHLRKCESCRAAAAEIQETLDLLKEVSESEDLPDRLSNSRRVRILYALVHPVRDWFYRNGLLVAVLAALLLAVVFLVLMFTTRPAPAPEIEIVESVVEVHIGRPDEPGAAPQPWEAEFVHPDTEPDRGATP